MPISTWPDKGSACLDVWINGGKLVKRNNQAAQSFFKKKKGLVLTLGGWGAA